MCLSVFFIFIFLKLWQGQIYVFLLKKQTIYFLSIHLSIDLALTMVSPCQAGTRANGCATEREGGSSLSAPSQSRARPPSSATCRGWTVSRDWRPTCEQKPGGWWKKATAGGFFFFSPPRPQMKRDPLTRRWTALNEFSGRVGALTSGKRGEAAKDWRGKKKTSGILSELQCEDSADQTQRERHPFP